MQLGEPEDRNQEGYFDKVGQLDLNQDQVIALLLSINDTLLSRGELIEKYTEILPELDNDEDRSHIREQIQLNTFTMGKLQQLVKPLEELVIFLDDEGLVIPKPIIS